MLGYALNGWQISGSVFLHSGVPFSVLSTPYSANGNGIVQGSGPQFASLVPGVDPYCHHCNIPGVTQPGTVQWLNPGAFVFHSGSKYRGLSRRRQYGRLPIWRLPQEPVPWSPIHLVRHVSDQTNPIFVKNLP